MKVCLYRFGPKTGVKIQTHHFDDQGFQILMPFLNVLRNTNGNGYEMWNLSENATEFFLKKIKNQKMLHIQNQEEKLNALKQKYDDFIKTYL